MFNGKVFLVGLAGVAMLGAACGPKSVALKRERELLRGGGVAAGAQAGTNPGEQAGSQAVSGPENGAGPAPAAGGLTPGSASPPSARGLTTRWNGSCARATLTLKSIRLDWPLEP